MDNLLGRKPAPCRDPTDRVVPLHFFENSLLVQRRLGGRLMKNVRTLRPSQPKAFAGLERGKM